MSDHDDSNGARRLSNEVGTTPAAYYAREGMQPLALLAFAVQRIARACKELPNVREDLLVEADADAMIVLDEAIANLPPSMKAIANARRTERARAGFRVVARPPAKTDRTP